GRRGRVHPGWGGLVGYGGGDRVPQEEKEVGRLRPGGRRATPQEGEGRRRRDYELHPPLAFRLRNQDMALRLSREQDEQDGEARPHRRAEVQGDNRNSRQGELRDIQETLQDRVREGLQTITTYHRHRRQRREEGSSDRPGVHEETGQVHGTQTT